MGIWEHFHKFLVLESRRALARADGNQKLWVSASRVWSFFWADEMVLELEKTGCIILWTSGEPIICTANNDSNSNWWGGREVISRGTQRLSGFRTQMCDMAMLRGTTFGDRNLNKCHPPASVRQVSYLLYYLYNPTVVSLMWPTLSFGGMGFGITLSQYSRTTLSSVVTLDSFGDSVILGVKLGLDECKTSSVFQGQLKYLSVLMLNVRIREWDHHS